MSEKGHRLHLPCHHKIRPRIRVQKAKHVLKYEEERDEMDGGDGAFVFSSSTSYQLYNVGSCP